MSDPQGKTGGGITGKISRSASAFELAQPRSEPSLSEESAFADNLQKLNQQLNYDRDLHDFEAEKDKHKFRTAFLWSLFGLTCLWLLVVIFFVALDAVNPSIDDRAKLLQMQTAVGAAAINSLHPNLVETANPHFCPILFHLSDSVLIAFITSTTVAVLGLFLTAARWLFGGRQVEKPPAQRD